MSNPLTDDDHDNHDNHIDFCFDAFKTILPTTEKLTKMFVRKAYRDLNVLIHSLYEGKEIRKVIVTGTPGVGKTVFMLYQLYMAKVRNKNVVLKCSDIVAAFMSDPRRVLVHLDHIDMHTLLGATSTLYFFDPAASGEELRSDVRAFTVVFASTNPRNSKIFKKSTHTKFFMPIWTLEELIDCRLLCYPSMTENEVVTAHTMWGGSARCVFSLKRDHNLQRLSEFVTSASLSDVLADMEGLKMSRDSFNSSQWLVHIFIQHNDYTKRYLKWASEYVMDCVSKALCNQAIAWKDEKNKITAGPIYEGDVQRELLRVDRTEKFIAKRLGKRNKYETITPPPNGRIRFANTSTTLGPVNSTQLYVPVEPNKESADFVYNEWIFQATLAKRHDIKARGINRLSKQFDRLSWKVCFCVPACNFDNFKNEQKITLNEELLEGTDIKQYCLPIDYNWR